MEIPRQLLVQANKEYWTRGVVHPNKSKPRIAITCEGAVVGFYTPHRAATGEMRIGPVWVMPEYRRRGLVSAVYASIEGPALAWVENGNEACERMLMSCGFARHRKYNAGWIWRRP